MKRTLFLVTIVSVLIVLCSGWAVLAGSGPDLFDVASQEIVKPDASLPKEVLDFFGTNGKWKGTMRWMGSIQDTSLVIKSMDESKAGVYCSLTRYVAEDATGRFSRGEDGRMRLIIPIPIGGSKTSDLVLHASKSGIDGTIGSLSPMFWPVK